MRKALAAKEHQALALRTPQWRNKAEDKRADDSVARSWRSRVLGNSRGSIPRCLRGYYRP